MQRTSRKVRGALLLVSVLACIQGSYAFFSSNVISGMFLKGRSDLSHGGARRASPLFGPTMQLSAKKPGKSKPKPAKKASSSDTKGAGSNVQQSSKVLDLDKREYIYQMYKLSKSFPSGKQVLNNINLSFYPGAKIGVLGSNGSGKSTLMRIMAGQDGNYEGDSAPARWAKIGYLEQEPKLDDDKTVQDNIEIAVADTRGMLKRFEEISKQLAAGGLDADASDKLMNEMSKVQDAIEAVNGWELERTLERALDALRCPPADSMVNVLSGGERRRVALCKLLLQRPDLLLLDEPTNHLDAESVQWLEQFLAEYSGTCVAITHDKYFLNNVCQWILELDQGKGVPYEGNYQTFLDKKTERMRQEKKSSDTRQKELEKELEWIRSSPKARQAKSKARVSNYEALLEEAFKDERRDGASQLYVPAGPKLGDIVVDMEGVTKGFNGRLLYEDLSLSLPRGGIVGVIGPNGCGKSTLFRMIAGMEQPDKGTVKVGETVKLMYVTQDRLSLDSEKTVFENINNGYDMMQLGAKEINVRQYLGWFQFKGADQQKKVGSLSGGERNRLQLACTLKENGNLLLLDEPTNDLDVDTLRALEEAVLKFAGCAVIISHDRYFLDRVATHILAFEGPECKPFFWEGNFESYEENRKTRMGETTPVRIKYRPLPMV